MELNGRQKFIIRQKISDYAKSLDFDLVGFSPAKIDKKYLKVFEDWLAAGRAADMEYMKKIEQRKDMGKILPGAKSVIVLGMNYYHQQEELKDGHVRIARYAYGRDYHKIIWKKLKKLEKFITSLFPGLTKSYVDTGPLMERALAEQAGLGRIGKNGCLITKEFGSWVFLAEIVTSLDLSPGTAQEFSPSASKQPPLDSTENNSSVMPLSPIASQGNQSSSLPDQPSLDRWSNPSAPPFNVCGNCRKCITACPTGAIIAPGIVDSRLCISYLTIENKKKISPKLAKIVSKTKRFFGCDICQEVCPHNHARQKVNNHKELSDSKIAGDSLDTHSIPAEKDFIKTFAGSPLMRSKTIRHHRIVY